jgi:hypothetical protein
LEEIDMQNGGGEDRPKSERDPVALMFDPMEQMRELLFGATKRETDRQITSIDERMENMRQEFLARFESLDTRLRELSRDTQQSQAESIVAIGGAIAELGEAIRAMGEKRKA